MKVLVRLHGTLGQDFPEYRSSEGKEVEIPNGATVKDLLAQLDFIELGKVAVIVDGRVQKVGDKIKADAFLDVFQSIQGG